MEEEARDQVENIEDHNILKYFEYVFSENLGFPPKREINLSINLVPVFSLVSVD
jgi:hypothetical protein